MISLREVASLIGVGGNFSLAHDFLKFLNGAPEANVSFRNHLMGIMGPFFTVNMIQISSKNFTGTDINTIDLSMLDVRDIYAQVGVGVDFNHITVDGEDADSFRVITKNSKKKKILRTFRGPGRRNLDALLVLVLQTPEGAIGGAAANDSPTKCKNKDRAGKRGLTVGMNFVFNTFGPTSPSMRARTVFGYALAHELGHLLIGKDHVDDNDNLMATTTGGADNLTESQGNSIRSSCAVVNR